MTEWAAAAGGGGGGGEGEGGGGGLTEGSNEEVLEGATKGDVNLNLQSLTLLNLASLDSNLSEYLSQNLSHLLNLTRDFDLSFVHKFENNRRVGEVSFAALLTAYGLLIVLGAVGNSLVVLAVVRKPAMRTARNVFIINLAISDLLLCLVTMPLTLMELLTQYWPLGDTPFVCRLVGTLQATSIFVSTISITAIALDRYHVSIVCVCDCVCVCVCVCDE